MVTNGKASPELLIPGWIANSGTHGLGQTKSGKRKQSMPSEIKHLATVSNWPRKPANWIVSNWRKCFILWLHSYVQGSQTCRMGMSLGKSMEMLQISPNHVKLWCCRWCKAYACLRHLIAFSRITRPSSLSHSKAARIRLGGFPGLQFSLQSDGKLSHSFLALRLASGLARTRN